MTAMRLCILTILLTGFALACSPADPDLTSAGVTIHVGGGMAGLVAEFVESVTFDLEIRETDDPVASASSATDGRMHVAVLSDLDCLECYRIDGEERLYEVHGDPPLGVQYGLAHLLELWGFRFLHPFQTVTPTKVEPLDGHADLGVTFEPETRRRGLHLHTLHPIEGLWSVWVPNDDALQRAERIVDWTVKNRGNHLQWVALEDIVEGGLVAENWRELTIGVNEVAHDRGLTTGVGIQLFGSGNLQLAFDLLDDVGTEAEQRVAIEERLAILAPDAGFDLFNLSFGEFFGEDPATFLASVDLAFEVLRELQPESEMSTVIHVGNYEDLQVEYQGQTYQYYFLTQFADPEIVPWVHSVMYFDLFEDAGGAYMHDEFTEHRQFLLDRLAAGESVGYFPESAYWCAFDNPIPTYLPLYVRSRFHDLDQIRAEGEVGGHAPLDTHVLFSSGWEWGYWQADYATLRMNYSLADGYEAYVTQMYEPWGADGADLSEQIIALADLQHEYLLEGRLAGYLAGRDSVMDLGYSMGIVSQPQRVTVEELSEMDVASRAVFEADVVEPLAELAAATWVIDGAVQALAGDAMDPWFDEVADGVRVDALRADFAHAIYSATLRWTEGGSDEGWLAVADDAYLRAQDVVAQRHAAMHDPDPGQLVEYGSNPTMYQYGYLNRADELCFWHKERVETANVVEGKDEIPPGCAL